MSAREYILIEAAGNRFALNDGFAAAPPEDPAAVARALAGRVDGLLLLDPPTDAAAAVRMTLYNTDGSRPEACGNGLRCIAAVAVEEGHIPAAPFSIETDAGLCAMEVFLEGGEVRRAKSCIGAVTLGEAFAWRHGERELEVQPVDVGNPHAVVLVDADDVPALEEIGPALEHHERFPDRANVEVVAVPHGGATSLVTRVWERGVGETQACGTGACASAVVAAVRRDLTPPLGIDMPGGRLTISWSSLDAVHLEGPVRRLGTIQV